MERGNAEAVPVGDTRAESLARDSGGLPEAIRRFYEINRGASERYVSELGLRKAWLDAHMLQPSVSVCVDGRTLDIGWALGLPMGMLEPYRSAGAKSDLRNDYYCARRSQKLRRLQAVQIRAGASPKRMGELAMFTVHHSFSQPLAGCAAWACDTSLALENAQRLANQYNEVFNGNPVIGFPMLVDTDWDAMTVIGPDGRLDVRSLIDDLAMQNGSRVEELVRRLCAIFPPTWSVLSRLEPEFAGAFHRELAELLSGNIEFVRNVIASKRPPELLEHQERMVFVGRHADWIPVERHNTIFLVDDTEEKDAVRDSFMIALRYVALNILIDAANTGDRDWVVPVVVNIPYEEPHNRNEAIFKARQIMSALMSALQENRAAIFNWISSHYPAHHKMPDWLFCQAYHGLCERTFFSASVSHNKSRLLEPID
jgi:hypothetical protein